MILGLVFFISITAAFVAANPLDSPKSGNRLSRLVKNALPTATSMFGRALGSTPMGPSLDTQALRFGQCQTIESHQVEVDPETVVAVTQRSFTNSFEYFVVFRDSCDSDFIEYFVPLDRYLSETVLYQRKLQEKMCDACYRCEIDEMEAKEDGEEGDDGVEAEDDDGEDRRLDVDCSSCYYECMKIENMEDNGYIDATEFIQCQMVYDPEPKEKHKTPLYAGPRCNEDGSKITIGIFTDDHCTMPDPSEEIENYLVNENGFSVKLSHALLKTTYSSDCVSCNQKEEFPFFCDDLFELFLAGDAYSGYCHSCTGTSLDMCGFLENPGGDCEGDDNEEVEDKKSNVSHSGFEASLDRYNLALTFMTVGTVALMFVYY